MDAMQQMMHDNAMRYQMQQQQQMMQMHNSPQILMQRPLIAPIAPQGFGTAVIVRCFRDGNGRVTHCIREGG